MRALKEETTRGRGVKRMDSRTAGLLLLDKALQDRCQRAEGSSCSTRRTWEGACQSAILPLLPGRESRRDSLEDPTIADEVVLDLLVVAGDPVPGKRPGKSGHAIRKRQIYRCKLQVHSTATSVSAQLARLQVVRPSAGQRPTDDDANSLRPYQDRSLPRAI